MSQLPITLSGNLTDDPVCKTFDTGSTLTRMRCLLYTSDAADE